MSRNISKIQNMQHELFLEKSAVIKWVENQEPKLLTNKRRKTLRYVDLFSGCGGLSYGINSSANILGVKAMCALAVDSKQPPLEVYKENIPHEDGAIVNASVLDVLNINSKGRFTKKELELKAKVGTIDMLVAGPPCQGHSDLNNSTRRNDPRNGLYMACIRAVELFEPSFVVIENVPTVIHSAEGVVQDTAGRLKKNGYYVRDLNIHFLDLGLPQTRRRHVLVASKDEEFINSLVVPVSRRQKATLREFISGIQITNDGLMSKSGKLSETNNKRVDYLFDKGLYDLPDEQRPSCHKDKQHSYKSVYGRLNYNFPAQTLTSGYGSMGQGRYIHPAERRTINSREASRIQGFPDKFDFSKATKLTDLRQMIANAVPPQLTYLLTTYYIKSNSHT